MKFFAGISLAAMIVICLSTTANAAWNDMGLTNGSFDTPGTSGTLDNTVQGLSFPAYNGTADNGKLFQDWKALTLNYYGAVFSYSSTLGHSTVARTTAYQANGNNAAALWVHDAVAGYTIDAKVYRLTADMYVDNYDRETRLLFFRGDTNTANFETWSIPPYGGSGSYLAASAGGQWQNAGGVPERNGWHTVTFYWDNTGSTTYQPWGAGPIPDYTYIVYSGLVGQYSGEDMRVGFFTANQGTSFSNALYLDNVTLSYESNIPEPATMGLLAVGGLAALIRRRRTLT